MRRFISLNVEKFLWRKITTKNPFKYQKGLIFYAIWVFGGYAKKNTVPWFIQKRIWSDWPGSTCGNVVITCSAPKFVFNPHPWQRFVWWILVCSESGCNIRIWVLYLWYLCWYLLHKCLIYLVRGQANIWNVV